MGQDKKTDEQMEAYTALFDTMEFKDENGDTMSRQSIADALKNNPELLAMHLKQKSSQAKRINEDQDKKIHNLEQKLGEQDTRIKVLERILYWGQGAIYVLGALYGGYKWLISKPSVQKAARVVWCDKVNSCRKAPTQVKAKPPARRP